jgi:hypothetical protein
MTFSMFARCRRDRSSDQLVWATKVSRDELTERLPKFSSLCSHAIVAEPLGVRTNAYTDSSSSCWSFATPAARSSSADGHASADGHSSADGHGHFSPGGCPDGRARTGGCARAGSVAPEEAQRLADFVAAEAATLQDDQFVSLDQTSVRNAAAIQVGYTSIAPTS